MIVACNQKYNEIVNQFITKSSLAFEPINFITRKAQRLEVGDGIPKPCREQEIASRRQPPHEEFEYGRLVLAAIQVSLNHVEFIKIGGERTGRWCHVDPGRTNASRSFARPVKTGQMRTLSLEYI